MSDAFFLISIAGVLVGVAGATGSHRFRRRKRPVAFRRHRRVLVPVLLVPAVALAGIAVVLDGMVLLLWWEWSLGLFAVFTGVVWVAGGIPGKLPVLLLRILLFAGLLAVPLSGIPFHRAVSPELRGVDVIVRTAGEALSVSVGELEGFQVRNVAPVSAERTDSLQISVDTMVRSAPLWWLPPSGTVTAVQVHRVPGEQQSDIVLFLRPATEPVDFAPLEDFLRSNGLIRTETYRLSIPGRPGWFLQPGRYHVTIAASGSHPQALSYRYTQQ